MVHGLLCHFLLSGWPLKKSAFTHSHTHSFPVGSDHGAVTLMVSWGNLRFCTSLQDRYTAGSVHQWWFYGLNHSHPVFNTRETEHNAPPQALISLDSAAAFVTVLVAAGRHNDNIDPDIDTVVTSLCLEDRKEMQHMVKVSSPLSKGQYQRGVSRKTYSQCSWFSSNPPILCTHVLMRAGNSTTITWVN